MHSPTESVSRGRGRPRRPDADARVLEAALEEYADRGWAGFTMDGVARRARVGKSTLYLRWKDKRTLLSDAVANVAITIWANDTGSLSGDLESLAVSLFEHYQTPTGWASLRLAVDATMMDGPGGAQRDEMAWSQTAGIDLIFLRAIERGDLDSRVDWDELLHCLCGSVTMQAIQRGSQAEPLSQDEISQRANRTVSFVVSGVAARESV